MNVRVIGLGNVLMSDDGFGPYVVRVLDALYEMPDNVQVIDAGTPGLDLTPYLLGADVVLFVDTVKGNGIAGDIHTYDKAAILARSPQPRLSPHDPGVKDALMTLELAGKGPEQVTLLGVDPEWIATGVRLSRSVRAAVAPVIELIVKQLTDLGCIAHPRAIPRVPDTWWEREALRHASEQALRQGSGQAGAA